MDLEAIDRTIRQAYRKNGREFSQEQGRTPLSDLIAKDALPEMSEMTEAMLCEFAAEHHIAIAEGLSREELVEAIRQALEINWEERTRGMVAMLDYFFADGPHPLLVVRRIFAIVKAVRPKLIFGMSLRQLAVLCDDGRGPFSDGRATQSARIKRLFEEPIAKAGMRGTKASFQKTEAATAKYAARAKGNQNRLGKDYLAEVEKQRKAV